MSEKGDGGMTQGECLLEIRKDSAFVEAVGSIDSFQARLGWTRVLTEGEDNNKIYQIQVDLHEIMGSLYTGQNWGNGEKRVQEIDDEVKLTKKRVKNLNNFLVSGENELESRLNICRTDCREAERKLVSLKIEREEKEDLEMDKNILIYFNRLSSFLNWTWRTNLEK